MSAAIKQRSDRGITLIEVLVAMVLFALFMATLVPMLSASALLRRQQELIAEATGLAQLEIEEIRRVWSVLDGRDRTAAQNVGGLTPIYMRDRVIPLPQPCVLSAVGDPACHQEPAVAPAAPQLTAANTYPFPVDGNEVSSLDPTGNGPNDLYLYDPNQEPPDTPRAANFTMSGVRGPTTYHVQVFWGYAPGSPTPADALRNPQWYRREIVRVVVRVWLAGRDGSLPVDSEGHPTRLTRPVRPVLDARADRLTDTSSRVNDPTAQTAGFSPLAPLVVLSTDIPRVTP